MKVNTQTTPLATAPVIASVSINPSTGNAKIGTSIAITVTAGNNQTGLTPSTATINNKQIALSGQPDGTYTGTYTIVEGDNDGVNVEATNITLTSAGGTSTVTSSTGSTLKVDAHKPTISSTAISPNSGWLKSGSSVIITVTAGNNEVGLTVSNASINGKSIPLTGQGNGTYRGTYTVQNGDAQGVNIEATGITLTDAAGNISAVGASTGSSLKVDTIAPEISSVTLIPTAGKTVGLGQSIKIVVTEKNTESGLVASNATIINKSVPLTEESRGNYAGLFTVSQDDQTGTIEATNITLKDLAGNVSLPASSANSEITISKIANYDYSHSDFNSDGIIDYGDFIMFFSQYGKKENQGNWDVTYDLNPDGVIDFNDFNVFAASYGKVLFVAKAAKTADPTASDNNHFYGLNVKKDESKSIYNVDISINDVKSISGFEFILTFNENSLEFVPNSFEGLVGINIPIIEKGRLRVATYFNGEEFSGKIGMKFKSIDNAASPNFIITSALVANLNGEVKIAKIPENTTGFEQYSPVINDLSIKKVSETYSILNWVAPPSTDNGVKLDGYTLTIGQYDSKSGKWYASETKNLNLQPKSQGLKEEFRISNLKPGFLYSFSINSKYGNLIKKSNIASGVTFVSFVDTDIDPLDPYIVRDSDSLFVADNDNSMDFKWSSWKELNATSYKITVLSEDTVINEMTKGINDTIVNIKGESGKKYSVIIAPVNSNGVQLYELHSRQILCPEGSIQKPGKPEVVLSK